LPALEPAATVCVVDDPRAVELSGLIATDDGYVSVIDSQFDLDTVTIVYLDLLCQVTRTVGYPTQARDPEDIAIAPDGEVWVADIGDNITAQAHRQTIALWQVPPGGGDPVIHRLTYPDGPHDAEALLFDGGGVPLIVTKEVSGAAGLYQPTAPLQPHTTAGVPMKRVGEFQPKVSGSANPLGAVGETAVTGAATSPDRARVALRTYTAAYEWDVSGGDVVKAITTGAPRITELPGEVQGEAIAYTVDGNEFLTLSDASGPTELRRYPRSTVVAAAATSATATALPAMANEGTDWKLWYGIAALGLGLIGLVVGLVAVLRSRRR
jgi:hypothetical protein